MSDPTAEQTQVEVLLGQVKHLGEQVQALQNASEMDRGDPEAKADAERALLALTDKPFWQDHDEARALIKKHGALPILGGIAKMTRMGDEGREIGLPSAYLEGILASPERKLKGKSRSDRAPDRPEIHEFPWQRRHAYLSGVAARKMASDEDASEELAELDEIEARERPDRETNPKAKKWLASLAADARGEEGQ